MNVKQGYKNFTLRVEMHAQTQSTVQLFNSYENFAFVQDLTVLEPNNPLIPYNVLDLATYTATPLLGAAIFATDGRLFWSDVFSNTFNIGCKQYPYRALLEFLKSNKIMIDFIRISGASLELMRENFTIFSKNIFGEINEQIISPVNFISPNQFLNIIDVPMNNLVVDGTIGIKIRLGWTQDEEITYDFFAKTM